jgi:hypothetical protein
MIRQTLALLLDAYRDLNARKLFWITLILSGVFVGAFATVSFDSTGLSFLKWHFEVFNPKVIYNTLFSFVIISVWLTWVATILALISTAGIFPDFVSGGSVDLYLSKPISRARLFLTKYISGLLFVTLQVIVVVIGSFMIFGIRGHQWLPSLLWAIPIVVCFYSYIFAICVFFGVVTRSTIAALLLTLLCWFALAIVDYSEPKILIAKNLYEQMAREYSQEAEHARNELRHAEGSPTASPMTLSRFRDRANESRKKAEDMQAWARIVDVMQGVMYYFKTVTPKTGDTVNLLDRYLLSDAEVTVETDQRRSASPQRVGSTVGDMTAQQKAAFESVNEGVIEIRSRSVAWVIGTSLAFEFVIVLWAGWIFCRRDY